MLKVDWNMGQNNGLRSLQDVNSRRRGTDDATLNSSMAAQADWEFCHWMWTAGEELGSFNGVEGSSYPEQSKSIATTPLRMDIGRVIPLSNEDLKN